MVVHVRTYSPRAKDLDPGWRVIDADGKTLGRLATEIATILRGKDKPTFTKHMAVGDFVIVINASKIRVSGQKADQKIYYHHTQYPGGLREIPYKRMLERFPERVIRLAVRGMLPHNRLGRQILRRLKVYPGLEHPHEAQVRAGQGKRAEAARAAVEQAPTETSAPTPARQRRASSSTDTPSTSETPRRQSADATVSQEPESPVATPDEQASGPDQAAGSATAAPTRRRSRAKASEESPATDAPSTSETPRRRAPRRRSADAAVSQEPESPIATTDEEASGPDQAAGNATAAPRRRRSRAKASEESPATENSTDTNPVADASPDESSTDAAHRRSET